MTGWFLTLRITSAIFGTQGKVREKFCDDTFRYDSEA